MNPNHSPTRSTECLQSVPFFFFFFRYYKSIDNKFTKCHDKVSGKLRVCYISVGTHFLSIQQLKRWEKKISNNGYLFEIWRQPKMFYWQLSHCMAWWAIPWHCDWCKNTLMRHSDWCKNTPMRQFKAKSDGRKDLGWVNKMAAAPMYLWNRLQGNL